MAGRLSSTLATSASTDLAVALAEYQETDAETTSVTPSMAEESFPSIVRTDRTRHDQHKARGTNTNLAVR